MTIDVNELYKLIESKDAKRIAEYMEANDLQMVDGKIVAQDTKHVKEQVAFWDQRQMAKKINLNA